MATGHEAPWRGRRIDAHVVAEVLAAELRADARPLREREDLRFELESRKPRPSALPSVGSVSR